MDCVKNSYYKNHENYKPLAERKGKFECDICGYKSHFAYDLKRHCESKIHKTNLEIKKYFGSRSL